MKTRFQRFSPRDLLVDHTYQRNPRPSRVAEIVADFNPDAVGVISVADRKGKFYVIDGQNRLMAVRELKPKDFVFDAIVYSEITPEQEAKLFKLLNSQSVVRAYEKFKADWAAGDNTAIGITDTMLEHKFVVATDTGKSASKRGVRNPYALEPMFRAGTLDGILEIINQAWPDFDGELPSTFVADIHHFIEVYPEMDRKYFVQRLSQRPMKRWRDDISERRRVTNVQRRNAARAVFVEAYNHRRSQGRLIFRSKITSAGYGRYATDKRGRRYTKQQQIQANRKLAYELHSKGESYAAIGRVLKLTGTRVSQLVSEYEAQQKEGVA